MGKLSAVVGGQFGSEAKGAVVARVARQSVREGRMVTVVRVAGHNAGHTAYDDLGRPWALRTVPAGCVDPSVRLVIAAGSEVNPDVLIHEVEMLEEAGIPIRERLWVDPSATWLDSSHIELEGGIKLHERTGSTGKGVGAARAARVMRTARTIGEWEDLGKWAAHVCPTGPLLRALVAEEDNSHVIIEGTQGYGLGVHGSHYPLTTSSDTRAIDFLAMAGIDPSTATEYEVWVVLRRFPIRVAGPSGALLGETTWEALGLPVELTTVTFKERRVGEWDPALAAEAVEANGGRSGIVKIAFSMADQAIPGFAGVDGPYEHALLLKAGADARAMAELVEMVEHDAGAPVRLVGTGPNSMLEIE